MSGVCHDEAARHGMTILDFKHIRDILLHGPRECEHFPWPTDDVFLASAGREVNRHGSLPPDWFGLDAVLDSGNVELPEPFSHDRNRCRPGCGSVIPVQFLPK